MKRWCPIALALMMTLACTSSPRTPTASPPTPDAPALPAPTLEEEREAVLIAQITEVGHQQFPEDFDQDEVWRILNFKHEPDAVFVEVVSEPGDTGYPSYVFMIQFEGTTIKAVPLVYRFADGEYGLLGYDRDYTGPRPEAPPAFEDAP